MLKPDSTRFSSLVQTHSIAPEWIGPDSPEPGLESGEAAAFHHRADLPEDRALDLRLHEILQQACLSTAASGAVIALARGDKLVCRATMGDKAPSAGVCLNTRSGLAGACVQTREMQLCDDTLADPRVNVIACRDLGIRSIVVLPVLDGGEFWGVLEVFSSVPRAFSDCDLQALQSLSRKISDTVRVAIEGGSTALVLEALASSPAGSIGLEPSGHEVLTGPPDQQDAEIVHRDYRTGALTAAVLALAVFLGWMVGRVGWSMAVSRAPILVPMASDEPQATVRVTPEAQAAAPLKEEAANPASLVAPRPDVPHLPKPAVKPKVEKPTPSELNGGLVVYEHGKVVFRMGPSEREAPAKVEAGAFASDAIQQAAAREDDGLTVTEPISSPSPNSYLLERVELEYPELARQQHIEGPVVLNVLVGRNGLVRDLAVLSGDPLLTKAATDAVRQWRFNPHQLKGKAVEFETRITVNFALPK